MTYSEHPAFVVSADWSKDASRRSVYVADLRQRRIRQAACPAPAWNLASLLAVATDLLAMAAGEKGVNDRGWQSSMELQAKASG